MPEPQITFRVNGQQVRVACDLSTPLGLVLRNELGLRGTRMGCEQGECGACTVVVDGHAVQSCDIAVDAVRGKDVLTIDGLVSGDPHPLVAALLEAEAGQCGFCLAGIVMAALPLYGHRSGRTALLAALERNLCRCGGHARILNALETALNEASP